MKPGATSRSTASTWLIPAAVAVLTFVAFLPALRAGFVTWDDNKNFTGNLQYRGLGLPELRWMWTAALTGHYIPLSWMTLGLGHFQLRFNAANKGHSALGRADYEVAPSETMATLYGMTRTDQCAIL